MDPFLFWLPTLDKGCATLPKGPKLIRKKVPASLLHTLPLVPNVSVIWKAYKNLEKVLLSVIFFVSSQSVTLVTSYWFIYMQEAQLIINYQFSKLIKTSFSIYETTGIPSQLGSEKKKKSTHTHIHNQPVTEGPKPENENYY